MERNTSVIGCILTLLDYIVHERSVASDSLQPHELWPTRLLCPWNFRGKNAGSGLPVLSPGGSSRPRDRIHISCYADGFFTTEPPRKPFCYLQFSSVAQSCSSLCDPMDCTILGLPVHHQCPELTQTHVHCIGDSIQLSHLLSSPSPPAFNHPSMRVIS